MDITSVDLGEWMISSCSLRASQSPSAFRMDCRNAMRKDNALQSYKEVANSLPSVAEHLVEPVLGLLNDL